MIEIDNWVTIDGDISLKTAERRGNGIVTNYQSDEIRIATRHCKQTRVAVDVGAHIGIISYQLSKIFDQVNSFEINHDLFPCLEENIKRQNCNNVNIYKVGLGDKFDRVSITKHNKTFGTHVTPNSTGNIRIKPLDEFNFENVDFIKIDVEGFEAKVIEGAMKTIERCRPVILYERKGHGKRYGLHNDAPLLMLGHLGYRKYEDIGSQKKNAVIGPKKNV
jgi:FkbM family methyltransferase